MKKFILIFLIPVWSFGQSIQVFGDQYTPQELIEDVLINNACISNIVVTNSTGGNFSDGSKSFGYFDASGTNFPLQEGLVLSTGKLQNVNQPSNVLSDDDAPSWEGDQDLDSEFNVDTYNATILEFDFVPQVSRISFRYLFASEEYQPGDPNTCNYSDVFAFFIKLVPDGNYENLARIPYTQIPVSVTTVHPYISQDCPAENESYFDKFNYDSEIVFDGQTEILTAATEITPGATYHVKMVIGDDFNARFDSAVFIEAGSFEANIDLGYDRLVSSQTALCPREEMFIQAGTSDDVDYKWYKDGDLIQSENNKKLLVDSPGLYSVDVAVNSGCNAYGQIRIEYYPEMQFNEAELSACTFDEDGSAVFNLLESESQILIEGVNYGIEGFFLTEENALTGENPIEDPENFESTSTVVYASVHNGLSCVEAAPIILNTGTNEIDLGTFFICDDFSNEEIVSVEFEDITSGIMDQLPEDATILFFENKEDAENNIDPLSGSYTISNENSDELFLRVIQNGSCFALTKLDIEVVGDIDLEPDETIFYCAGDSGIEIKSGVDPQASSDYTYQWYYNDELLEIETESILVEQIGIYRVVVTNVEGCTAFREIELKLSETALITGVDINSNNNQNEVTVMVSGEGEYQYALDSTDDFQESSIFTRVSPGAHVVYVRDINGCGISSEKVTIFGYDKFFTPNGDGFNDTWKVYGVDMDFYIAIFNRYGKLMAQLDRSNPAWNGRTDQLVVPAGEYWFRLELENGEQINGHFSLVR